MSIQDYSNFGFEYKSLSSWTCIADQKIEPLTSGKTRDIESFMVAHTAREEARRVTSYWENYNGDLSFDQWVVKFLLSGGHNAFASDPMNRSTSLMSNLKDDLRAAFWAPTIREITRLQADA